MPHLLLLHLRGRAVDRFADARVGAAAADVRSHVAIDLVVGRLRVSLEQRRRAHDLPRLAVAALRDVLLDPGLLHGRQRRAGRREAFDRRDLLPDGGGRGDLAGLDRRAVQVHRAGAALTDAAAVFRADEAERIAQHPEQRRRGIDVVADGMPAAVDGQSQHACSSKLVGPSRGARGGA
jgi:hypothetical protein